MRTELFKAADNLWVAVKAYVVSRNSYPEWNALHNAIAEYGRARKASAQLRPRELV